MLKKENWNIKPANRTSSVFTKVAKMQKYERDLILMILFEDWINCSIFKVIDTPIIEALVAKKAYSAKSLLLNSFLISSRTTIAKNAWMKLAIKSMK